MIELWVYEETNKIFDDIGYLCGFGRKEWGAGGKL